MLWSTKQPAKIPKQLAHKALSGSKGYLSSDAKKALSKAGIGLNKSLTKKEVQKAYQVLQEAGEASKLHTATSIAESALKEQQKREELAKNIRTKKFVKSYLAEELAEERAELLGKIGGTVRHFPSLSKEFEEEEKAREEKGKEEKEKRKKLIEPLKTKIPISPKPGGGKLPPDIMAGL